MNEPIMMKFMPVKSLRVRAFSCINISGPHQSQFRAKPSQITITSLRINAKRGDRVFHSHMGVQSKQRRQPKATTVTHTHIHTLLKAEEVDRPLYQGGVMRLQILSRDSEPACVTPTYWSHTMRLRGKVCKDD